MNRWDWTAIGILAGGFVLILMGGAVSPILGLTLAAALAAWMEGD